MMLLDKPYVSEILSETLAGLRIPVVKLSDVMVMREEQLRACSEEEFIKAYQPKQSVLVNSENALTFIENQLPESLHAERIRMFKDKYLFREIIKDLYPNFHFEKLNLDSPGIRHIAAEKFPLILKPVMGYSSVGVYKVDSMSELDLALGQIRLDLQESRAHYPSAMFNHDAVLLESWIPGVEYAIDAYFNSNGDPVILNVFSRVFSEDGDTSDRIYYTSKKVIEESIPSITNFLRLLGSKITLTNFPLHVELRRTDGDEWIPVEINPLRFAGIGTAELGVYAYGINVYSYFYERKEPDWEEIIRNMDDNIYSFFCLEFPITSSKSEDFKIDEEKFTSQFGNILEYRKIPDDPTTFAVVFYQSIDMDENYRLIRVDLDSLVLRHIHS